MFTAEVKASQGGVLIDAGLQAVEPKKKRSSPVARVQQVESAVGKVSPATATQAPADEVPSRTSEPKAASVAKKAASPPDAVDQVAAAKAPVQVRPHTATWNHVSQSVTCTCRSPIFRSWSLCSSGSVQWPRCRALLL